MKDDTVRDNSGGVDLFVSCLGGIEPLLIEELAELGYPEVKEGFRGVYLYNVPFEAIYKINYNSRLAGRVLMPLKQFRCYDQKSIYNAAMEIDWSPYLPTKKTFAIDANVDNQKITNSLYAAQVLKDAICDQLRGKRGERPSINVKDPDVQLNLFIHGDKGVISFDTSGTPLFKRGYRQESVEAPIQESLAAAILRIAKYKGEEILCDPCCGSGTFLIEAALIATQTPPGYLRRRWAFTGMPGFNPLKWLEIKELADKKKRDLPPRKIFGIEISRSNTGAARRNARAAGFDTIEVIHGDFRDVEPTLPPQLIVANPPHGNRIGEVDMLKPLYRSLGDFMKRKASKPARGFVFTGSLELAKEVGLSPTRRHVMNNSGIDSRLLEFDLY